MYYISWQSDVFKIKNWWTIPKITTIQSVTTALQLPLLVMQQEQDVTWQVAQQCYFY